MMNSISWALINLFQPVMHGHGAAGPTATFPAVRHRLPSIGTKLCHLVIEARVYEQPAWVVS